MASAGTIEIRHDAAKSRFECALDDGVGVCEYRRDEPGVLTLTHTEVPPSAAGRGVAAALVHAALDWARAERLRVRPLCSYAATYIERHPATHDLRL
jgi:uncharacterized protein